MTSTPSPQYYTCSCILAFVACSVFLRMSLELKVVLLTVALVAYLVLFNTAVCAQRGCCGRGLGNHTETNATLRWAPRSPPGPRSHRCCSTCHFKLSPLWWETVGGAELREST